MQLERFRDSPVGELLPLILTDPTTQRDLRHAAYVPKPLPAQVHLRPTTYKAISEADRAIGALDGLVRQLPNPGLLVRPSQTREAVSTSALEGTFAPLAEVLEGRYVDINQRSAEVREIQNYVLAADRGLQLIQDNPIMLKVVTELQGILVRGTRSDAYDAGEVLQRGVGDWEKWVNTDQEMPILVKIALAHYQFETLHPFSDGNGRIGRLIITLQLIAEGVLSHPVLNLSPWLEPRRDDYIDHLQQVSMTGDFDPWVRFFANAVAARARAANATIERLQSFQAEAVATMKEAGGRGAVLELAANLVGYPIMSVNDVQEDLQVSYPTANSAVAKLVQAGFLREITGGRYARLFRCDGVYTILAES